MQSYVQRPDGEGGGAARYWPDGTALIGLLLPIGHSFEVAREHRDRILSRVQMAAAALSLMTLAWILVDVSTIRWPYWGIVAAERLVAAAAFALLAVGARALMPAGQFTAVGILILIPVCFLLGVHCAVGGSSAIGESVFVSTAYLYAPFLIAVSFSLFPMTALESAILSLPVVTLAMVSVASRPELFASPSATMLRLALIIVIAALASMSQLRLLIALTEHSVRDQLTGALTRRAGEQRLLHEFARAMRKKQPMAVAFFDIDSFKSINDQFGHARGDDVLRSAARSIHHLLDPQEFLIRWGGEEFVLCLPRADLAAARRRIAEIGKQGLGNRPDGCPATASVGLAEYRSESIDDPATLVRIADERMYAAKAAGKNCCVDEAGQPTCFIEAAQHASSILEDSAPRSAGHLRPVGTEESVLSARSRYISAWTQEAAVDWRQVLHTIK